MHQIPRLGFGTWARTGPEGIEALACALDTGYRHIDTAQSYGNETEVGTALRDSAVASDEVWITTKIDPSNFARGRLIPSLKQSVEKLGVVPDLTLIHWPAPGGTPPLADYLEQIGEAKAAGLTREVGVSNFPIALLTEAIEILGESEILTNQIELNPAFRNAKLAAFCEARGILVTCYQPVAQGRLEGEPTVEAIAATHGATANQIALAWELAHGYVTIPTSSSSARIASNFEAPTLDLSASEIAALDRLAQDRRAVDPDWAPKWDSDE